MTAEWGTPPELFDKLNRKYRFDYDPFATHENRLCPRYSTTDGTFHWDGVYFNSLDGLAHPWENLRVFMNPPYTRFGSHSIRQCFKIYS